MRIAQHGKKGEQAEVIKCLRLLLLAAIVALCSCSGGPQSLLPKSGGRPYEVMLVASDGRCAAVVDSVLAQDMPSLPQPEPMFDVSRIDSTRFNQTTRLARCIVIVTVNPAIFTSTRIRYEKNVWARPQLVVYVNTPSASQLSLYMAKAGRNLTALLARAEINTAISALRAGSNPKAENSIRRMFGWDMRIPADMKAGKTGRNFIWLSDNGADRMRNICVYSYSGTALDAARALAMRDSVMKANIPGELDGMYMQTVQGSVTAGLTKERKRTAMICRGLWEMRNDAMGGPFVSYSTIDSANSRIIVAEAFVYAPGIRKRNLIRSAEAALYTLDKPQRQARQKYADRTARHTD
ncbi:DUF4837 family protein [uncultured Prevotella sp.]|uniref:DUF4837 family protein n=1 Tax=uncultured Prevotella sp. TaxID=159272 RepID=UPI0026231259|nr:DUF4837 family protein [uncultured Prevotella sp.]